MADDTIPVWAQQAPDTGVPQWAQASPSPDEAVITAAMQHQASLPPDQRAAAMAALPQSVRDGITAKIRADAQAASSPEARAQRYQQLQDQNVADMGTVGRFVTGVGEGAHNFWQGAKENLIDRPLDFVTGGNRVAQDEATIADQRQLAAPLNNTAAGAIGNFVGGAAESAPLMLIPGGAETALARTGLGALTGAAYGYLSPSASSGEEVASTATGALVGGAARAASPILDYLGMKAAPVVSDAKQAGIDLANKYGIPLHLSQVTDSKALQTLGSASKYLPFSGNAAAQRAQQGAFNRALSQQIGEDTGTLSDQALSNASTRIGQGYNDLFARNNVQFDPQTIGKLGSLWQQAGKDLTPDQAQVVQNQIKKYFDAAQANGGSIPGRLYQNIRTELQNIEGGNAPATHLVGQVRKTMQDAADNSMTGDDAALLKQLNGQYGSLKILQKGINKRAAGAGGDIAPANLWGLVNSKYKSTPEMRDLARMGQTVLKDPIPDSGTAARNVAYGALGIGGAVAPHTVLPSVAAGMTLGRALNSPFVARNLPYAGQNALGLFSRGARALPYTLPTMVMDWRSATPPASATAQTP